LVFWGMQMSEAATWKAEFAVASACRLKVEWHMGSSSFSELPFERSLSAS
jgi:hypothetical protein